MSKQVTSNTITKEEQARQALSQKLMQANFSERQPQSRRTIDIPIDQTSKTTIFKSWKSERDVFKMKKQRSDDNFQLEQEILHVDVTWEQLKISTPNACEQALQQITQSLPGSLMNTPRDMEDIKFMQKIGQTTSQAIQTLEKSNQIRNDRKRSTSNYRPSMSSKLKTSQVLTESKNGDRKSFTKQNEKRPQSQTLGRKFANPQSRSKTKFFSNRKSQGTSVDTQQPRWITQSFDETTCTHYASRLMAPKPTGREITVKTEPANMRDRPGPFTSHGPLVFRKSLPLKSYVRDERNSVVPLVYNEKTASQPGAKNDISPTPRKTYDTLFSREKGKNVSPLSICQTDISNEATRSSLEVKKTSARPKFRFIKKLSYPVLLSSRH